MPDPTPDRPHMPGYEIETSAEGLLPWSWAEERLIGAKNYFVASARDDGAPHVMPVWGVWVDGALWFSTSPTSAKSRNLLRDARCSVATESAAEAVVLEGTAQVAQESGADLAPVFAEYKRKYDWDAGEHPESFWVVRPRVAFGFMEAAEDFTRTATRWRWGR